MTGHKISKDSHPQQLYCPQNGFSIVPNPRQKKRRQSLNRTFTLKSLTFRSPVGPTFNLTLCIKILAQLD